MKFFRFFAVLTSVLLLLSVSQIGNFYAQATNSTSNSNCANKITKAIQEGNQSGDKIKAISLALNSTEFKSKVKGYNYTFSNMYNSWTWNHKTCSDITHDVNVVFTLTDSAGKLVKYVVVVEDSTYAKIKEISEQKNEDDSLDNMDQQTPNKTSTSTTENQVIGNPITLLPLSNQTQSLSPLKQIKSGVSSQDVACKPDFQLLIKLENNSPVCVKPASVERLAKHGWVLASYSNSLSKGILIGTVTLSPCRPVERVGDMPCFGNGSNYTVTVYQSDGTIAGQANSDQNGIFKIELNQGDYIIHTPYSAISPNSQTTNQIKIEANKITVFNIVIDSGIR
ncbi:MAG: hypothetical protein ACREAD_00050 [Nitrosopumilaceae archaeon]